MTHFITQRAINKKYSRVDDRPECLTASSIVEKHLILLQSGELLTRFRDVKSSRHSYKILVPIQRQLFRSDSLILTALTGRAGRAALLSSRLYLCPLKVGFNWLGKEGAIHR